MNTIRVLPGKNEDRFMELFKQFKYPQSVVCRLGAIIGKPYNEYDITDYDYDRFEEELNSLNYISKGEIVKMSFIEKAKNFVKEHPMEIMIGVGGAVIFACGAIVGAEIKGKMDLDIFDDSVAKAAGVAGAAGMGCVGGFIHDNVPEADKMINDYCAEHNVDFWKLFRECPRIESLEKIIEREIPCPVN